MHALLFSCGCEENNLCPDKVVARIQTDKSGREKGRIAWHRESVIRIEIHGMMGMNDNGCFHMYQKYSENGHETVEQ